MQISVSLRHGDSVRNVLVTTDPATTIGQLFGALGVVEPASINGRRPDPARKLSESGLRHGAVIDIGETRPAPLPAEPGQLALLVVGGPAAGTSCTLGTGRHLLGRNDPFPFGDPDISRRHAQIDVDDAGGLRITDLGSTNGTTVEGEPVTATRALAVGDVVRLGRSAVMVAVAPAADAAIADDGAGRLRYSRPPRLRGGTSTARVQVPFKPAAPDHVRLPMVALVAPVVIGVAMAFVMHHLAYLAFTAMSPVMMAGSFIADRRNSRRTHRAQLAEYQRQRDAAVVAAQSAQATELGRLRFDHPDPATAALVAAAPNSRLWERQRLDDDFLTVRVGTADLRASVDVVGGGTETRHALTRLHDAPVTVPLARCGAVGIAGPRPLSRGLARAMLLSVGVLHSPRDIRVTLLSPDDAASDWDWLRWLPHARFGEGSSVPCRIGNDADTVDNRIAELSKALDERQQLVAAGTGKTLPITDVVVVDNSYQLRLDTALGRLLRDGPALGVRFICLDESAAQLPEECKAVVTVQETVDGPLAAMRLEGHSPVVDIAPDVVPVSTCEAAARALAPITDVGVVDAKSTLPTTVKFLELAGLEPPTAEELKSRWAKVPRTTKALVGVGPDGPFVFDLAQGPHALVAGTTGAGKSEFLKALVASLAVGNRPDAMNFVLVDYKGGAAFRGCTNLPHTVGMLTDLDAFLVERALTSLRAELQRRKAVLDAADKPDIGSYWAALATMPGADPLPRLVVVVDEFRAMHEQLPELLTGLVDIAAQGRSLGIHLVLATQRPAGAVTADIQANISLRVALRTATVQESNDVLGSPAAASIPAPPEGPPGRGYVRIGTGRPIPVQTAHVSGRRSGVAPASEEITVFDLGWLDLGRPLPVTRPVEPDPRDPTDLSTLVDAICAAAGDLRVAAQRSPWQPPLPDNVLLSDVGRPDEPAAVAFGLEDRPAAQLQRSATFELREGGNLLVAGGPKSGRTTLLRTLAGSIASTLPTDAVHLYAIDCGGGGLAAVSGLPHCGAVVTPHEPERVTRLLNRLVGELEQRSRMLADAGYGDLAEYLAAGTQPVLPFLVLLVDRYDAFVTALENVDSGQLVVDLQRLVRDGLAAGIRVVVTGDRALVTGKLGGLVENKLVLRMADRMDYSVVGLSSKAVPDAMPTGRGFLLPSGNQVQVAVLSEDPAAAAQNQALRELAREAAAPTTRPFRVDALPALISYDEARRLPSSDEKVFVGVGGDDLRQLAAPGPGFVVLGAPGSGRSSALAVIAQSAAESGMPIILVTPRKSRLSDLFASRDVALRICERSDEGAQLPDVLQATPVAVFVDDAELLTDTKLGDMFVDVLRSARDSGHRVYAAASLDEAASTFRGLIAELRKARQGLILNPTQPTQGDVLGARLPRSVLAAAPPGRAALVTAGTATAVQVPTIDSAS